MKRSLFCILAGVALLSACACGSDWPQYKQNAARTGDAFEEALELPMKRVVAVRFPAPIYASPAVVGGKVYIQDARGNVACIDGSANKVLWVTELGGINNVSSPAVADGKVYIGSNSGYLAILDASTGKLLKKVETGEGVITAPAIENGSVYFSSMDGALTKIDMEGNVVWTFRKLDKSHTEFAVKGQEILYTGGDRDILEKGRRGYYSWHVLYKLRDEGKEVKVLEKIRQSCPSACGLVFGPESQYATGGFMSESGKFLAFLGGEEKFSVASRRYASRGTPSCRGSIYYRGDLAIGLQGNVLWQADDAAVPSGGYHSSPALARDFLVIGTEQGAVVFFDIAGDREMKLPEGPPPRNRKPKPPVRKAAWSFSTMRAGRSNGAVSSSPAIAGGKVFFGGEDGALYGLGNGEEVEIVDALPGKTMGDRALPGSKLEGHEWHTVGGDVSYACVSPDTTIKPPLRVKWRTRVWDVMKGPVIVGEGKVFVGSRLGQVAALDAESGEIIWRANHPNVESRAVLAYAEGRIVIFRCGNRGGGDLWCHDAKTGEVAWHKDVPYAYHYNADGPAVYDGKALACWKEGKSVVVAAAYNISDGTEAWVQKYEVFSSDKKDSRKRAFRHFSCVAGNGRFYFSVLAGAKGKKGCTMAVDAKDGSLVWKTTEYATWKRSRIALRKGILVVFGEKGGYALDAKTGNYLWTGGGSQERPYYGSYYMTPLTDGYLESKGTRSIFESGGCRYGVYADGVWYGHWKDTTVYFGAFVEKEDAEKGFVMEEVWRYPFLSHACPGPAIAYGRLYYSPNGEGIVYCFERDEIGGASLPSSEKGPG